MWEEVWGDKGVITLILNTEEGAPANYIMAGGEGLGGGRLIEIVIFSAYLSLPPLNKWWPVPHLLILFFKVRNVNIVKLCGRVLT